MNTQSHAIINVALLSRKAAPYLHRYALIGAVLPDVPMFILFCGGGIRPQASAKPNLEGAVFPPRMAKPL